MRSYMVRFLQRIKATGRKSSNTGEKRVFWGSHNFKQWVKRQGIYSNLAVEISRDSELLQVFNVEARSSAIAAGAVQAAADGLAIATFDMDMDEAMVDPIMGLRDEVYLNLPVDRYALVEHYNELEGLASAPFPVLQIEKLLTGLLIVNLNMAAARRGFQANMFIREIAESNIDPMTAAGRGMATFYLVRFRPTVLSDTEEMALDASLGSEFLLRDVDVSEGLDVIMSA